jgi:hypothetical protein
MSDTTKNIDWNIWHDKVKDAKAAFQIDDMLAVCNKLNIAFGEDDPISFGGISDMLDTSMEWIIEHYCNKWDGSYNEEDVVKFYKTNCYLDESGFITVECHLKKIGDENTNLEFLDPYIKIVLLPADNKDLKISNLYFKIEFIIASQIW